MRLHITTVRKFPDAERHAFVDALVEAHHARGDHELAIRLASLRSMNRLTIKTRIDDAHEVETIYELLGE